MTPGGRVPVSPCLTFHTTAASLENIGVHFHPGLRQKLISCQVGVVRGGNEVIIQRLRHVLGHLGVLGVENVPCRTAQEVCKTCRGRHTMFSNLTVWFRVQAFEGSSHHRCPSPDAGGSQGKAQTWSQYQPDVLSSDLAPASEAAAKFNQRLSPSFPNEM